MPIGDAACLVSIRFGKGSINFLPALIDARAAGIVRVTLAGLKAFAQTSLAHGLQWGGAVAALTASGGRWSPMGAPSCVVILPPATAVTRWAFGVFALAARLIRRAIFARRAAYISAAGCNGAAARVTAAFVGGAAYISAARRDGAAAWMASAFVSWSRVSAT